MNCHQCGHIVTVDDRFCEECGVNLLVENSPVPSSADADCLKCSAPAIKIDADRYCIECGYRQPISDDTIAVRVGVGEASRREASRREGRSSTNELQASPNLAGATDRGRRHHQNEDAIGLQVVDQETYIMVVCDGVSSSQHPELASQAAVTACIESIATVIAQDHDPTAAISSGIAAALKAVASIPIDPTSSTDPSSTTIVTAIVTAHTATIGWLGDSRAYWIAATKSLQLTQDDSWMRDAIESGAFTRAEAAASPYAHAIVRWLGADVAEADSTPNITTFPMPGAGYLLLCTDGLWNYAPDPTYLHHLIQQSPALDPLTISRHLIRYANQQGGQDNITVGIMAINDQ